MLEAGKLEPLTTRDQVHEGLNTMVHCSLAINPASSPFITACVKNKIVKCMFDTGGEGREIRIVNRFCIAWNRGFICLPSSHMLTWTYKCSTFLTTASRCYYHSVHSSEVQFISKHIARSRCLACVVSHCPAKCSSLLTRHSRSARVLRWWSAWCMLSSTYMDWERGVLCFRQTTVWARTRTPP